MGEHFNVYLPCEIFPVMVRYGLSKDLTKIESLILRAVSEGENRIDRLAEMFGFKRYDRMMFDLLRGLWRAGHLIFNFDTQRVYLSAETARLIKRGKFEQLERASAGYDKRELMFDLVTGHVLHTKGLPAPPAVNKVIPHVPGAVRLEQVTYEGIRNALSAVIPAADKNAGMRVLEATVALSGDGASAPMRWLRLNVECDYADDEHEQIEVRVLDSEDVPLPYATRRALSQHLTRVGNDDTYLHFNKRLREKAGLNGGNSRQKDVRATLHELAERAATFASRSPREASTLHDEMKRQARLVAEAVAADITEEATLRVVAGQEEHRQVVKEMLERAEEQVVISSPFVSDFDWLEEPIRRALEKQKRVIILWGLTRDGDELPGGELSPYDRLPREVKNQVEDIKSDTRLGKWFFFSPRPAGTHAKVVVSDNRLVLITSMNLLKASRSETVEVGVLAGPPPVSPGAKQRGSVTVASDILTWAREILSDRNVVDAITIWPKEVEYPLPQPALPAELAPVEKSDEEPDEARQLEAISVWASGWVTYLARLRALSDPRRRARLIRDVEHRQLFERSLKTASLRLLVTSDQISDAAVRPQTRKLLRELSLDRRVPTRMVFRSPLRSAGAAGEAVIQDIRQLEQHVREKGGDLQFLQSENHSKVLVCDDTAVVSSFNFLSHSGRYASTRGSQSAELGLELSGPGVADEVVAAVVGKFPGLRALPRSSAATPPSRAQAQGVAADAAAVIEALAAEGRPAEVGTTLAEVFATAPDPWALLESITELPLTPATRRRVVATCLIVRGDTKDAESRDAWLKQLARDAWVRGDAVEAHLLLAALTGGAEQIEGLPHPLLVEVTAVRPASPVSSLLLLGSDMSGLPQGQRTALAMAAVCEVLRPVPTDEALLAEELLGEELLGDALPTTWKAARRLVLSYFRETYEPFPHRLLASTLNNREQEQRLYEALDTLRKEIEAVEGKQFRFDLGTKTWEHLFHRSGLFGRLLAAARAGDAAAVRTWYEAVDSHSPDEILDEATLEAAPDANELIEGGKRESLKKVIAKIILRAKDINEQSKLLPDERQGPLVDAAKRLARELKGLEKRLAEEASAAVDEPAWPLSAAAMRDLEQLMRYSNV